MSASSRIRVFSHGEDVLEHLAAHLLQRHAEELPFLGRHAVVLPDTAAGTRFRRLLLRAAERRGVAAVVPPWIGTLRQWVEQAAPGATALAPPERELLLYEAIAERPALRRYADPWALAENLLELFDALALSGCLLGDLRTFRRRIHDAYGLTAPLSPADDEARLVHAVWRAWRDELRARALEDPTERYVQALSASLERLDPERRVYLAGFIHLSPAEADWVARLLKKGQGEVFVYRYIRAERTTTSWPALPAAFPSEPPPPTDDPFGRLLDAAYTLDAGPLDRRARRFKDTYSESPAAGRLAVFEASDAEREAYAVDVQVRQWYLSGRRPIGIVTADRRLARRVRALLERAGIQVQDAGGWRLSTTSAAACVARLLEAVESGYAPQPLLDLLKSPFVGLGGEETRRRRTIACLEREAVLECGCRGPLAAYAETLDRRRGPVEGRWGAGVVDAAVELLAGLGRGTAALEPFLGKGPRSLAHWLEALQEALVALGIEARLAPDAAGEQLLDELELLQAAAARRNVHLSWEECRRWLGRHLERRNFQPPPGGAEVELMDLPQSRLWRFEALVIAGASAQTLPGLPVPAPVFNDAVRLALGLPSADLQREALFHDFRHALEAAPRVLVTLRREHQGEPLAPSPWLERLLTFHELAYGTRLPAEHLAAAVASRAARVTRRERPLPVPRPAPAPTTPTHRIPVEVTPSSHQRLLDCPYQYFAADCLGLESVPQPRESLEKRDYGEYVHRILRAFHIGVPGLPGPFTETLTHETFTSAERLLERISEAVFAPAVRRNFLARGWLYRWQRRIRPYLQWQMRRERHWKVVQAEVTRSHEFDVGGALRLTGRIDRIDAAGRAYAVIDYKTGRTPAREEVECGESIQLPLYVLLWGQSVEQALFVALDREIPDTKDAISGTTLSELVARVAARLVELTRAMRGGAALPAHGDSATCARCPFEGLCRRPFWCDVSQSA